MQLVLASVRILSSACVRFYRETKEERRKRRASHRLYRSQVFRFDEREAQGKLVPRLYQRGSRQQPFNSAPHLDSSCRGKFGSKTARSWQRAMNLSTVAPFYPLRFITALSVGLVPLQSANYATEGSRGPFPCSRPDKKFGFWSGILLILETGSPATDWKSEGAKG